MTIHIVQAGETISSISEQYKIPVDRLIMENGITNPENLAIGQTIVIVQPKTVYVVQPGDTLASIAQQYNVSPMEILRNNPNLSDRVYLYAGETIVIEYQTNRTRTIATSGYTFSYIDRSVLIKTLPFLSYLTIFNYRATEEAEIVTAGNDTDLIHLAESYGVAPIMFVSTIAEDGMVNREVNYTILNNPDIQVLLIENSLQIMKEKGYHGINIYIEDISYDNIDKLSEYLRRASAIFRSEGFRILITITPVTNIDNSGISLERIDYSKLADYVDGIIFASYDWARTFGYPSSVFPVNILTELLDYSVDIIPPEKIFLGITTLGYDWSLPYIPGSTGATIVTNNGAVQIAAENNIPIQFNEPAQSPYFYYMSSDGFLHVIWFKDARSFEARINLVSEYNLQGLSVWTIMRFDAQMWLIINNEYYIEKPHLNI
ncbi:LysM peptidoglycan-binding domain-containing protein [Lacrimispora aerotolerans]|uniref:LysM peptidoglycan-binding domain-containing protein n=1 Tax=Lacrimispora aerotolerans TaxID=36832 RepID=UPI00047B8ACA|nr:LysM peptidoglycan-binding domain-containing protein [Lacrimispora aerotolerans]